MHLDVLPASKPSVARNAAPAAAPTASPATAPPFPLDIAAAQKTALSPSQFRAALALAEAILPGSAKIPAADERTVLRAEDLVRVFHPTAILPFGASVRLLDSAAVLSTGRPFHKLDANKQQEMLRAWDKSPVMRGVVHAFALLLKFAHFDQAHVYEQQGGRFKSVQNMEKPRHFSQIHRASEWDGGDVVECDVVVVGTGAGGAVVGRELAELGHAVVFVEEGEHYTRDTFNGSATRAHGVFYRNALVLGNAPMPAFVGRMLGGSTAVNGATSFRTPPWVLEEWCETFGTDELSPDAMRPVFERVEGILQVGLPHRRHIGPIADVLGRGCDALGWSHGPIPRNAVGCEGGGFCDFGCSTGAKRSTEVSYLPTALNRGAIALTGLRASRVLIEAGRAVGIEGVAANGRRITVRGRAVILSGGAIPTPELLLKLGLCNSSGQVGKNLTLHPSGGMMASLADTIDPHKYIPQAYFSGQFLRQGVLLTTAQPDFNIGSILFPYAGRRLMDALDNIKHTVGVGVVLRDSSANGRVYRDVGGKPVVTYNMQPKDLENFHFGMIRAAEMLFAAGAKRLMPAIVGHDYIETPAQLDAFRKWKPQPSRIALTSYHPLGTCKMGLDPKTSVVGTDHQTHDTRGLFIVDGSTVPTALGVNPQITIMAMATRAASKIHETL